ncbi:hypothetical protein [Coprococcus comes]|uniref:hypothetical protein n=1 Tax=Coprococcus comes TaxID=410072 RepID=UPI00189AD82D|nr:hypothetical protein [Coprococcus comes]
MRIISQSGLLDVPYELIAISPYSGNMATIIGTFPGNDLGKGDRVYILAEYSTEEKAIKAMEMCRERYTQYIFNRHMIPETANVLTRISLEEAEKVRDQITETFIFQFPKEEEIEDE